MDKKKIVLIAMGVIALGSLAYYFKTKKKDDVSDSETIIEEDNVFNLEREKQLMDVQRDLGGVYSANKERTEQSNRFEEAVNLDQKLSKYK